MTDFAIVKTTVSTQENADKIISALLDKKLIACAQVFKIESHYVWDGKIHHEPELTLILKTKKADYKDIEQTILKHHSYDVAEIISFDINTGSAAYLNWINDVTR